jgi:hypothetical protein
MGLADARKPETTSAGRPCDTHTVRSTHGTGQDLFSCTIGSSGCDGIRYSRLIDPSRGVFTTIIGRFQRSTAVTASTGRNRRYLQHLDALEVRTRSIHGRAQSYCGLGGHACAEHGHIVGRAQVERRRCRHPARHMFLPNPRRKNREGTSTHNSPAKLRRWCDFMYRFEVIFVCSDPDCSFSPTSSGRCGRTRRAGGGHGRCFGLSADAQRSARVCMPFCGLGSVSHTQDVNRWCSCISRSNA